MIFIEHNPLKSDIFLTLFRMGFFRAAHGWGGAFLVSSYNDETWHRYTLPKEDPKEDYFNFS